MKEYEITCYPKTGNYIVRENDLSDEGLQLGQYLKVNEVSGNITLTDEYAEATLFRSELECQSAVNSYNRGPRKIKSIYEYLEAYSITELGTLAACNKLPKDATIGDAYIILETDIIDAESVKAIFTPVYKTTTGEGEWKLFDADKAPTCLYEGGAPGYYGNGVLVD